MLGFLFQKKPKVEHLCVDCRWYVPHFLNLKIDGEGFGGCDAPQNLRLDREAGNMIRKVKYANVLRKFSDECGPRGRWWEPREKRV